MISPGHFKYDHISGTELTKYYEENVDVCFLPSIFWVQNAKIIPKIRYPLMKWWCVKTLQYNFSKPLINAIIRMRYSGITFIFVRGRRDRIASSPLRHNKYSKGINVFIQNICFPFFWDRKFFFPSIVW